jgi:hypothetical protein
LRSPQFIRNYSSVSNPPAEYTAVFIINISTLLLFAVVFAFEFVCAFRRRIVALQRGESEAMQLHPRWFSAYRYKMFGQLLAALSLILILWCRLKRWKALVGILLSSRAGLKVRFTFACVHFYGLVNICYSRITPFYNTCIGLKRSLFADTIAAIDGAIFKQSRLYQQFGTG